MNTNDFLLFAFATLMLNLTPGTDMIYVATRSTTQGTTAGIVSALGIAGGCLVHTFASVVGLSVLISESAVAFNVVKFLGVGYLCYLGITSLISKEKLPTPAKLESTPLKEIFWQGVYTNVLNPKVALFFLAFLPQFADTHSDDFKWQVLGLGAWFNVSGTLVNILVAVLFGKAGSYLNQFPHFSRIQNKMTGGMMLGLGVCLAFAKRAE
ncbi:LysE family translocator [Runella slithyformis]|uniref:Lysine exporter protein (LYSE/YGGA) n=1 Tax=Runella slithyformis (strain ATCC 29530 / DSM 19594 / LMG 11500 / NCIMB 11436 / LSU 4) TaxID=761193 RepID=A0A7U3ZLT0_RUNSL|nr:LysE family translocator [Runella slithyformis]AEI49553.1 Lysine exporter protein (LYSE/YGGA) [Runella slithyformis DSM 19594]